MKTKVDTNWVTITPQKAAKLLESNDGNRNLSQIVVNRYAREMLAGRWRETGDPIRIDWNGNVLDGQHRLWACIESGRTFRTLVVEGLDPSVFPMIDRGRKRSTGDALYITGEKDTNNLAAALAHLWRYEHGVFDKMTNPEYRQEPEVLLDLLQEHLGIRESVAAARVVQLLMPVSLAAFLHYQFNERDPEHAEWFFEALAHGVGLERNDPVLRLRERLLRNRMEKSSLPAREIAALVIKAWNYSLEGRPSRSLMWKESSGEAFPEIKSAA